MNRSFSISRTLLIAAMLGLMGLAALGFRAQQQDMEGFRQSSQESIHWSSAQVEVELSRFIATLGQYSMGDPEVDARRVNHRFDILWSRTGLFRNGRVGERLREYDKSIGVIPDLVALLERHEEAVVNLKRDDRETHLQIIRDFTIIEDRLRALSVRVLAGEERRFAAVRDGMRSSGLLTLFVSAASLVLASILVGVVLIENKRVKRQADESAALAAKAEAANRAKSKFLTMMSHELRTPMNGVLGLMALAKQSGLNERQVRLIEQAERSGERMIGLLGDILDFSDLQMEEIELDKAAFELDAMVREIDAGARPVAERMAGAFTISRSDHAPPIVIGDYARLRQSLMHLLMFVLETVGSKDVVAEIDHEKGQLVARVDMQVHAAEDPGWQPEALFGREEESGAGFSSDALGPAIARGMVSLMQGTVVVERHRPGRAQLIVSVPAEAVRQDRHVIRIESVTQTTDMVLRAVVGATGWPIWDGKTEPGAVCAVLVEIGAPDEPPMVARLRSLHPNARLIALGLPEHPHLFDETRTLPLTADMLKDAVNRPAAAALG